MKNNNHLVKEISSNDIKVLARLYQWCDGQYTYNTETGLIDVDGSINCSHEYLSDFLGFSFGNISGDFRCEHNNLKSLEGGPITVKGTYNCSENLIEDLKYAPQWVEGEFDCRDNEITSFEGSRLKMVGSLDIRRNPLISLKGAPEGFDKTGLERNNYYFGGSFTNLDGIDNSFDPDMVYFETNKLDTKILNKIYSVMYDKKVSYLIALTYLNFDKDTLALLTEGLGLDKETIRGASLLGKFSE